MASLDWSRLCRCLVAVLLAVRFHRVRPSSRSPPLREWGSEGTRFVSRSPGPAQFARSSGLGPLARHCGTSRPVPPNRARRTGGEVFKGMKRKGSSPTWFFSCFPVLVSALALPLPLPPCNLFFSSRVCLQDFQCLSVNF